MLQLYFANPEVREDLLAGPMGPYLPALAVKLCELGYSRDQARRLIVTADALGCWLKRQGVNALSMSGGIEQWSKEIDPKVPRY